MNNSKNSKEKITINNEDYGLNKGFSSSICAEWLQIDMEIMSDYNEINTNLKNK